MKARTVGGALDPQTARVLADLEGPGVRPVADMTPDEARAHIAAFAARWDLDPKPAVGAVEGLVIPGPDGNDIRARLYRPAGPAAPGGRALIVFFHAGGYVFGGLATHDGFCRLMAAESGCMMLSVDYRLAPEHKFPAAHEDCYAALCWAAGHAAEIGADAARVAVGGDSSGGTLAIAVCQLARARGGPAIAHQLLWYPGTAGGPPTESMRTLSEGHFLTAGLMKWSMGHYLDDVSELDDPLIAPMRLADVSFLPPTWLMTAGFDPRRDDNAAFAGRLEAAGVAVRYRVIDSTVHGFLFMLGGIDRAVEGARESAAYARAALAPGRGSTGRTGRA